MCERKYHHLERETNDSVVPPQQRTTASNSGLRNDKNVWDAVLKIMCKIILQGIFCKIVVLLRSSLHTRLHCDGGYSVSWVVKLSSYVQKEFFYYLFLHPSPPIVCFDHNHVNICLHTVVRLWGRCFTLEFTVKFTLQHINFEKKLNDWNDKRKIYYKTGLQLPSFSIEATTSIIFCNHHCSSRCVCRAAKSTKSIFSCGAEKVEFIIIFF